MDDQLGSFQRDAFSYFRHEANPHNGLIRDKTASDWPASIAATGLALAAYPVAVERGFNTRTAAVEMVLATLRFFWNSEQSPEPDAPATAVFTITFSTCRPADARGNANSCPLQRAGKARWRRSSHTSRARSACASRSPRSVSGMSVRPVCCPLIVQAVSPCRTR